MQKRVESYDFIRSVSILLVFLSHTLDGQVHTAVTLTLRSLSPGLTMSLLGFISAALLSTKQYDSGEFLIKRFTRIYVSLILCLVFVLAIHTTKARM